MTAIATSVTLEGPKWRGVALSFVVPFPYITIGPVDSESTALSNLFLQIQGGAEIGLLMWKIIQYSISNILHTHNYKLPFALPSMIMALCKYYGLLILQSLSFLAMYLRLLLFFSSI